MKNIFIMFLSVFVILGIYAQNNKKELPGDTKLPSSDEKLEKIASYEKKEYKYSVEDFFKNTKKRYFKLSPDGKYLSYMKKNEKGKRDIYIKNTVNDKKIKVIEEGKNLIRVYFWANNNRLIYFKDKGGNENYHLFAVNIDGSDQKKLTPFDNVKVKVQKFLKEKPNSMIILMNKENSKLYNPYKINIKTGELNKLYDNDKSSNPITSYDFDKEGNLRGYFKKIDGIKTVYYYRETKNKPFKKIIQTDWDEEFKTIGFDYSTDYKHDVFVLTNLFKNTKEIIKYDLKKKKIINYKFSNEKYDLKGISRSRKRDYVIDYYYYTAKKSKKVPVSQSYKKLHKKFTNKFGEYQFFIVDRTKKEDKYLLFVRSDKLYGAYYQYDRKKDSFKKLARLFPHLKEKDMAEMKSIKFESRDGLTIHGYITIPEEAKKGKKVPLIVNPHGGPYGIRDSWRFDPKAQLFASRGYATLQINYRGSGGYGKSFQNAGYKQVGRKMLNDLEDGVKYMKHKEWVDENRIAIYGASYGGLATLGSLVKTPDLYCCGVDYVGVSNIFTFFESIPSYWKPYLRIMYKQWYNPNNKDERKIMKKVSPALNVDKITKPLFIVQGANDPRVDINESDQMVRKLRKRGIDVFYMVKYNEGHGFRHEDNRIQLYKTMMGFFAKHLK